MNDPVVGLSEHRRITIADIPIIAVDIPVMYEDEGQDEMGESLPHVLTDEILHNGLQAHLADRPEFRVFSNLNLYYHPIDRNAYVSPDGMVVTPSRQLKEDLGSYRIGEDGPAPLLTAEILSKRSAQQQDLSNKVKIYADLRVAEYILVDITGRFLPQKLLLKRLQPDKTWRDEQDPDGGVTSSLGFRLVIESDGQLRVIDAATGRRYVRPLEAEAESAARQKAEQKVRKAQEKARKATKEKQQYEERVRELEAELARLRAKRRRKRNAD